MNPVPATTVELKRGDRVELPNGLVRTVEEIVSTEYVNTRDERVYAVRYQESGPDEWADVNVSGASDHWFKLAEERE